MVCIKSPKGKIQPSLPARFRRVLCNVQGDTMVEVLAAILIAALGASLLVTMIMGSTNVTASNQSRLSSLYSSENSLTSGTIISGTSITVQGPGISAVTLDVDLYADNNFTRYEPASG